MGLNQREWLFKGFDPDVSAVERDLAHGVMKIVESGKNSSSGENRHFSDFGVNSTNLGLLCDKQD